MNHVAIYKKKYLGRVTYRYIDNLLRLHLREKKQKSLDSENEAKQN